MSSWTRSGCIKVKADARVLPAEFPTRMMHSLPSASKKQDEIVLLALGCEAIPGLVASPAKSDGDAVGCPSARISYYFLILFKLFALLLCSYSLIDHWVLLGFIGGFKPSGIGDTKGVSSIRSTNSSFAFLTNSGFLKNSIALNARTFPP